MANDQEPTILLQHVQYRTLHLRPGGRTWIDQIEVSRGGNLQIVYVLAALLLLFRVIAAQKRRDGIVRSAVDQPLRSLRDFELHGIGFTIMLRNTPGFAP